MTAPNVALDEQIAFIKSFNDHDDSVGYSGRSRSIRGDILATLQSIKDAGDDVVDSVVYTDDYGNRLCNGSDYDTLLFAYKRVQQEKKTVIDVYEGNLRDADKRLIFWQERAEKAESERDEFRKALQSIAANTCCANCQEAALVARAAIDSARNK